MAFVDTSFLFALTDGRDDRNRDAADLFRRLGRNREPLTITTLVLGEAWTLAGRRLGHRIAAELLRTVRRSSLYDVRHVDGETAERAFDWLLRRDERDYSFVDATSFQIMWDLRIDSALSFDTDFDAVGFQTLRA